MHLVLHLPYHEALARERALLGETPHDPELKWMVWQTPPCIVVPRSHANYHNFEQAIAASEARGCPVFLRDTGGGAVVQGPDVINLSMRFSADATGHDRIGSAYRLLCQPLMAMLATRGITGHYQAVSGSMCDGIYNVVVADRKLAGTAQRWKALGRDHPGEYAVLAHFAMFLSLDHDIAAQAINALYADMAMESDVQAPTHINWIEIDPTARADVVDWVAHQLNGQCVRLRNRPS